MAAWQNSSPGLRPSLSFLLEDLRWLSPGSERTSPLVAAVSSCVVFGSILRPRHPARGGSAAPSDRVRHRLEYQASFQATLPTLRGSPLWARLASQPNQVSGLLA